VSVYVIVIVRKLCIVVIGLRQNLM